MNKNTLFIATTTINSPSVSLKKFSKMKNVQLVVALDKKSKKFNLNNTIILSCKYQQKKWGKLSSLVGWNCIQRRNFAILECLDRGANKIALIDDDNIPLNNWNQNIFVGKNILADNVSTNLKCFDP